MTNKNTNKQNQQRKCKEAYKNIEALKTGSYAAAFASALAMPDGAPPPKLRPSASTTQNPSNPYYIPLCKDEHV